MRPAIDPPWTDTGTHECTDCGAESRDGVCPACVDERNDQLELASALDDLCAAHQGRGDFTREQMAIGRLVKCWEAMREKGAA